MDDLANRLDDDVWRFEVQVVTSLDAPLSAG
jgi:hypothetical protein